MRMGAISMYAAFLTAHGHPAGTIEQYTGYPRRLLADTGTTPRGVTGQHVVAWLAAHNHWAPNTRRKAVANLRLFFAWALEVGLVDADPTTILKPVRGAVAVPRPMPEDLYRAALAGSHGHDRMLLRLAAETGLRRAELAALHSDDAALTVCGWALFVDGKGRRQRHVPIPADIAEWVQAQQGYVFPSPVIPGAHMIPSAVGKRYRRLLGDQGWTTHTLRHRYATRAYAACHDIEAVRTLLGHDSVRTTQIYIQVAEQQLWTVAATAWQESAVTAA